MAQDQKEKSAPIIGQTSRLALRGKSPRLRGVAESPRAGCERRDGEGEQASAAVLDGQKGQSGHAAAVDDKQLKQYMQDPVTLKLYHRNARLLRGMRLLLINAENDDYKEGSDDDENHLSPRRCPPPEHHHINWNNSADK